MSDEKEEKLPPKNSRTGEHLKSINKMSLRERKEFQSKGGKASAEKKREKRELKNIAKLILDTSLSGEEKDYLKEAGFKPNQVLTKGGLGLVTSLRKAIKYGNIDAIEKIAKIAGEFEEKINLSSTERKIFNFVPCDMSLPKRPDETPDSGTVVDDS